ncbi:uncharacterized protein LOC106050908 isoform X2 [Biomphalaria glabrata]|uniref:Uncharacterized protein LOC106050908 isoform X2 n=1 Tax=Biomphalaria glabrata TaxID=6526 RepID=A0A9W2Z242_BIOGL|nr:uncharacterized protein LOC106050908 isoform X2 [Biomphalaria glabrata]
MYLTDLEKVLINLMLALVTSKSVLGGFSSSPKDITPHKTSSLSLRCEPDADGSGAILAIHIKKKEAAGDAGNSTSLSDHVMSQRGVGESFVRATITAGNKITVVPTLTRFQTEGTVTGSAYLMVTIQSPDIDSVGLYECQVTRLDDEGNVKVNTEVAEVLQEVELSLETLQTRVKTLESQLPTIKVIAEAMARTVQEAKSSNELLEKDVAALKKENQELSDVVTGLTNQIRELTSRVDKVYNGQAEVNLDAGHVTTNDYSKLTDIVQKNQAETESRKEELEKVKEKLEELESTRIHILEEQMQSLREREKNVEDLAVKTEFIVNASFEPRIKELEKVNWKELYDNLDDIENKMIPNMVLNISKAQEDITELQKSFKEDSSLTPSVGNTTQQIPTTKEPPKFDGPACYVCGDNTTQKQCTSKTSQDSLVCPAGRPACMTDVYQNGVFRRIYRRCVTQEECQASPSKSNSQCKDDNFMDVKAMECHFCCTSQLCNDYIRPSRDLVS